VIPLLDQSNDQGIFNEILSFLAGRQAMEFYVELEKHIVHGRFLLVGPLERKKAYLFQDRV
jgi:hypothetical protein